MRSVFKRSIAVEIAEVAGDSDLSRVERGTGFRMAAGYILVQEKLLGSGPMRRVLDDRSSQLAHQR